MINQKEQNKEIENFIELYKIDKALLEESEKE